MQLSITFSQPCICGLPIIRKVHVQMYLHVVQPNLLSNAEYSTGKRF